MIDVGQGAAEGMNPAMNQYVRNHGRTGEILLVDDNRGDAMLAARAFSEGGSGMVLTVARTGEEALDALRGRDGQGLPDLVLLDLGLPRMGGMDVLAAIKQDAALKHIPVIVMSNSGADDNVVQSYRASAAAYIVKPADLGSYRRAAALIEQFFFGLACLPAVET